MQQPLFEQDFGTDEKSVACKGGKRLIRRIAITCRTHGQGLPPMLTSFLELVDPSKCNRSHVSDPIGRGQGRDRQQHAGSAIIWREGRGNNGLRNFRHSQFFFVDRKRQSSARSPICCASLTNESR